MYEYVVKSPKQLYKYTYNKFTNVYIKFINSFKYISLNFDSSIINCKDDIKYLLYELLEIYSNDKEHSFKCKSCGMNNTINLYSDIESNVSLQCDYCKKYRDYHQNDLKSNINSEILDINNINNYKVNKELDTIVLFIVKSIN